MKKKKEWKNGKWNLNVKEGAWKWKLENEEVSCLHISWVFHESDRLVVLIVILPFSN